MKIVCLFSVLGYMRYEAVSLTPDYQFASSSMHFKILVLFLNEMER